MSRTLAINEVEIPPYRAKTRSDKDGGARRFSLAYFTFPLNP